MTRFFTRTADACAEIFSPSRKRDSAGKEMRIASPLGLGKPNTLLNLIYEEARMHSEISLKLYTALSLLPPYPRDRLAENFIGPFRNAHWGENYPDLKYARDGNAAKLPANVSVHEFYFQAGGAMESHQLQQAYQSINYTHVVASLVEAKVEVLVQLIAKRADHRGTRYSLSSNPDLTLDLVDAYRKADLPLYVVGVVHRDLPFLGGEAEVPENFFSAIVEDPETNHELFALPRTPISPEDHLIGFHASGLIADGGTLQIGIGSLSDAVVHALLVRHRDERLYSSVRQTIQAERKLSLGLDLQSGSFREGLYGLSEMINDGFMHLRKAGILKREVIDEVTGNRTYLHGAFYLGSKAFYRWLRELSKEDESGLRMSRISKINDLYDPNEILLRRQRKKARFLNTCMQVSLLGGAASETLEDGRVVSGVGGQYNFVSMSHELEGARSILMLRSTRVSRGKRYSNIVWGHRHLTIPRHLRDIVVTEYGAANLRNRSDEETITELLNITDSQFQDGLLKQAQKLGKVRSDYEIPDWAKKNTPGQVKKWTASGDLRVHFPAFPFGSDFTPVEERLALALGDLAALKESKPKGKFFFWTVCELWKSIGPHSGTFGPEITRMNLGKGSGLKNFVLRRLLIRRLAERLENQESKEDHASP